MPQLISKAKLLETKRMDSFKRFRRKISDNRKRLLFVRKRRIFNANRYRIEQKCYKIIGQKAVEKFYPKL